ncbi:hypothetical protein RN001_013313 [Aquatica leii]|uniref:Neuropeptide-like 1 n=1 Tax=Aquatica leii TaxID=1421715 RepID=A0AAN7P2M9_9COLE|nr:hypothetical protein RN001_013313 [Aquatica leii]
MLCFFPPKILFCCGILWLLFFDAIKSEDPESPLSTCEIERLLKPILSPPDDRTIQAQALRNRLINLIRQGLDEQIGNELDEKRSISSLARWNDMPMKRNIQSLAREGYLRSNEDNQDDADLSLKRSIQSLARLNQFPEYQTEPPKRSISSLARNGELFDGRRNLEDLLDELYEKRNIGSLARDFNFPTYGKRFIGSLARNGDLNGHFSGGKRNLASVVRNGKHSAATLARANNLPEDYDEYKRNIASLARDGDKFLGKRNVAAMLRQDNYLNEQLRHQAEDYTPTEKPVVADEVNNESKRNLASVKAGYKPKYKRSAPFTDRNKREADYYDVSNEEYIQPVYQNQNNREYEELLNSLYGMYPNNEKRFLGSLARSGWPTSLLKYKNPDKRHIGSLARLGWLPSFRSARRFNRSGRSTNYGECGICRETAADGEAEDDTFSESPEDKRFLLIPAANSMFLRKLPVRS